MKYCERTIIIYTCICSLSLFIFFSSLPAYFIILYTFAGLRPCCCCCCCSGADWLREDESRNLIIIIIYSHVRYYIYAPVCVRAAFHGGGGVAAARLSQESHGRPITVIRSRFPISFRDRPQHSHRR